MTATAPLVAPPRELTQTDRAIRVIKNMEGQIKAALPANIDAGRFARIVMTALRTTPGLVDCHKDSFLACVLQCAQWGLAPNDQLGNAYLIPYGETCTLQIGYKGLRKLAKRSGAVDAIHTGTRYKADLWSYTKAPLNFLHEPFDGDVAENGDPVCYYAAAYKEIGGQTKLIAVQVMWPSEIEKIRKEAPSAKATSPWKTHYDSMARKTALRKLCNQQLDLEADDPLARAAALDLRAELGKKQTFDADIFTEQTITDPTYTVADPEPEPEPQRDEDDLTPGRHQA